MIYTYVCDFSKAGYGARETLVKRYLDAEALAYVENTKNPELKKARSIAYSLLFFALRGIFPGSDFSLMSYESGKPYILCDGTKDKINISISHSSEFAAVTVSDTEELLGVDLQDEIYGIRAAELCEKYFSGVSFPPSSLQTNVYIAELLKNGDFSVKEAQILSRACESRGNSSQTHLENEVGCDKKFQNYLKNGGRCDENAENHQKKECRPSKSIEGKCRCKETQKNQLESECVCAEGLRERQGSKENNGLIYATEPRFSQEPTLDNFFAKWAVFESVSKCTGRGIGERKNIESLLNTAEFSLYRICVENKRVYLSVARIS